MTRGELMAKMDSAEFSGWIAYDNLHGLPDRHASALVAIGTTLANLWSKRPFKVSDFLPLKRRKTIRQSTSKLMEIMGMIAGKSRNFIHGNHRLN